MTVHPAVRAWLERMSLSPRRVAQLGIVLGVLASWLALPPLRSRLLLWPILVGILAVACGIWAISRAERRVGWGAGAAGLAGVVGGVLATRSSVGHLDEVFVLTRRQEGRFIDDVGQVGAHEARGARRNGTQLDLGTESHLARMQA